MNFMYISELIAKEKQHHRHLDWFLQFCFGDIHTYILHTAHSPYHTEIHTASVFLMVTDLKCIFRAPITTFTNLLQMYNKLSHQTDETIKYSTFDLCQLWLCLLSVLLYTQVLIVHLLPDYFASAFVTSSFLIEEGCFHTGNSHKNHTDAQ